MPENICLNTNIFVLFYGFQLKEFQYCGFGVLHCIGKLNILEKMKNQYEIISNPCIFVIHLIFLGTILGY